MSAGISDTVSPNGATILQMNDFRGAANGCRQQER